ncbi:MAG TPA: hypothetical protein VIY48_01505, partial [Candidatus Paceibacterota bacterium]
WLRCENLRRTSDGLIQTPPQKVQVTSALTLQGIATIPTGRTKRQRVFLLGTQIAELTDVGYVNVLLQGPDALAGRPTGEGLPDYIAEFRIPDGFFRWAWVNFEDKIYISNRDTPIHVITMHPWVRRMQNQNILVNPTVEIPCGQYLETFYDHLVVGNVTYQGVHEGRVQWSGLRDFGDWLPKKNNEADYFDFIESQDHIIQGVTGLKRFGRLLAAYTSDSINLGTYVGLPGVIRWEEVVHGIGNDFPWAVVGFDRYHFFISEKWRNFAVFDGTSTPQPIGDPIAEYFFNDLSANNDYRYQVIGWVDQARHEIVWNYCAGTSVPPGTLTKQVVYDFIGKTWSIRPSPGVIDMVGVVQLGKQIDSQVGTIDGLTGSINGLGLGNMYPQVWLSQAGHDVYVSGTYGDTVVAQTTPLLETGDLVYGDIDAVKEVEAITIHAALGTAKEIKVEYSVRDHVSDTVSYTEAKLRWTPTLRECRVPIQASGKIWRYRFTAVQNLTDTIANFVWYGHVEYVYGAKQVEK